MLTSVLCNAILTGCVTITRCGASEPCGVPLPVALTFAGWSPCVKASSFTLGTRQSYRCPLRVKSA
jgi:hypothetical protein